MNKTAAAFVFGSFATAAALLYSGLNGPAAAFALGFIANLVAIGGVLSSRRRIRMAADLLNRIAGKTPSTRQERAKAAPQPAAIESDVVTALIQLGASKPTAAAAAAKAFAAAPAAGFDSIFRNALQFTKA